MRKHYLYTAFFFLLSISLKAQQWQPVGTAGFSAGTADHISLTLGSTGVPYVAFVDGANSDKTTVMKFDGSNWVNVGTSGISTGQTSWQSIIIDGGVPYVAYQDGSQSNKVTVQTYDGSNWTTVGSAGFSSGHSQHVSLMMDNGALYAGYSDYDDSDKSTLMTYNGSNWVAVGTPAFTPAGAYASFAVDNGTFYAAYANNPGFMAHVMSYSGSSWSMLGAAAFSADEITGSHMAVDNGIPYITYGDVFNNDKITVMKYDSSNWVNVGTAGFSASEGEYPDLIVVNGTPYVVFQDAPYTGAGKATVMKYDGSDWVNVGVAGFSAGQSYYHCIAAHNGSLYVAYQDVANGGKVTVMTYDLTIAVKKVEELNKDIRLFPNPVKDLLYAESSQPITSISILSTEGKFIKSADKENISVADLPPAAYIIQVKTEKGIGQKLFVKK
jgi:hypothetical protein